MRKVALLLILICGLSFGEVLFYDVKNSGLSFKVNREVKPDLDFGYTHPWNNRFFSRLKFSKSVYTETDKLIGFSESRRSTTYDEIEFYLTPVGVNLGDLELSAGLSYIKLDRLEFGYVQFPQNIGGDWVSFENRVKLEFYRPTLSAEYKLEINYLGLYLYADLFIFSNGRMNQETFFKPIVSETATNSTSISSNFSYKIGGAQSIRLGKVVLSVFGEAETFSVKYDLKTLDRNSSGFFFRKDRIESEETSFRYGGLINFLFLDRRPFVGYYVEIKDTKDKNSNSKTSLETQYIVFGFLL